MNLLKDLVDSLATLFSNSPAKSSAELDPASGSSIDGVMDSTDAGTSISNERTAYKLGGYFDLAKEEIAKALRAEEWGLTDDAIAHYNIALQLLVEAQSLKAPSFIGFREREKINFYHQKILKWQCQVSDRLQTLSQRTAITPTIKNSAIKSAGGMAGVSSVIPNRQASSPNTHGCGKKDLVLKKSEKNVNSKADEASVGYDTKLVEMVSTMIVDGSLSVRWNDINGLEKAKQTLMEMVILPTKRRDLFTGLRKPPRGLLLFGPPGNGKTMLAKAVASESDATFFNISSSSLTSKWVGEGEKLMRALFMVAASKQPSVIFFDEIDSMMSSRTANEHDASRRLKSEFLVQFDGVNSKTDALVIVIGATNRPQELDDAVIRRLVKRIYVPLPDLNVRTSLLKHKLKGHSFSLPSSDLEKLAKETDGYSGSDIQALCEEAAMIPIRELGSNILTVKPNEVRHLTLLDFQKGMAVIRPSLKKSSWEDLEKWNSQFGSN